MKSKNANKKNILYVVILSALFTPFMVGAINVAIPAIGNHFKSNTLLLSWVVTGYFLASAPFMLPLGKLADIIGRKKIFTLGIISFTLISLLCGLAWSIKVLIIFRVIQGIASAMIFSTYMALLTSIYSAEKRGKALGIYVASVYIGLTLGPLLGGIMNQYLGWRSIFYFNFLVGIIIIFIITKIEGEWTGEENIKFDLTGAVYYTAGFVCFLYGLSSITNFVWSKYIMIAGFILILIFIKRELRVDNPIFNFKLITDNKKFALSNLAALFNYTATYSLNFLLAIFLQQVMNFNSQTTGLILLVRPLTMSILSTIIGRLFSKTEPRLISTVGLSVSALSLFSFSFISNDTSLYFIIINLFLMGSGLALFTSPNINGAMSSISDKHYGVASSTINTMRTIGQSMSMALVTLIISFYAGNIELSRAPLNIFLKITRLSFLLFAVLCLLGILFSYKRGKIYDISN